MTRRCFGRVLAAAFFATALGNVASAQVSPGMRKQYGAFDPNAAQLLRKMVTAERTVPYIARESTLRADSPGAEHIVKFDPKRGLRREPANGKGRVILDTLSRSYFFSPGKPGGADAGESRFAKQYERRVKELVTRLGKRVLSAQVVGQDTVAGRTCDIVEVRATRIPDAATRRFWIDRDTGLRLRTEEKNAGGKVLSGSYYTSLDLNPKFAPNDFVPPTGAGSEDGRKPGGGRHFGGREQFPTVAEARSRGVVTPEPAYLPPGYALRQVESSGNGRSIALRYANGLNALSLTILRDGVPRRVSPFLRPDGSAYLPFPQGKHGLFLRGENGGAYLLIGDLPEGELRKIAASVK